MSILVSSVEPRSAAAQLSCRLPSLQDVRPSTDRATTARKSYLQIIALYVSRRRLVGAEETRLSVLLCFDRRK
jgi:hypothetical protein